MMKGTAVNYWFIYCGSGDEKMFRSFPGQEFGKRQSGAAIFISKAFLIQIIIQKLSGCRYFYLAL